MSEIVCQTIAEVPGLLPAVIERLEHDVDAVRLINNLAANCMRSAQLFVNVPGSLKALKGSTKKFKLHSFGVISHLSRCPEASRALIAHGFVHEILYPALDLVRGAQERGGRGARAGRVRDGNWGSEQEGERESGKSSTLHPYTLHARP
jgi:hypothetical protein